MFVHVEIGDFEFLSSFSEIIVDKLSKIKDKKLSCVFIYFCLPCEFSDLSIEYLGKKSTDTITVNCYSGEEQKYQSFIYLNIFFIYMCFKEKLFSENTSKGAENSIFLFILEKIIHSFAHSLGFDHHEEKDKLLMFKKEKKILKSFSLVRAKNL